jgi:hypothetical protein
MWQKIKLLLLKAINLGPLEPINLKKPKYTSVLNKSPYHESIRWRGGTASRVLNVLFNKAGNF